MGLVKRRSAAEPPPPPEGREAALGLLHAAEASLRRGAVRALANDAGAVPLLCARLAEEPSLSVRSLIFTVLIAEAGPAVVEGLVPLLRSEDANLRNGAIEALQAMPDAVAPAIERLLADEDSDVRIFTVNVLAALPHPAVPRWLVEVITRDAHVNVCAAAIDALAEVGEPDAIPALQALATRFPDIAFIDFAVTAALRRIDGR